MASRRLRIRHGLFAFGPLVLMALFIALRMTVGESSSVIYGLMALPAPGWPMLFALIALVWLLKKQKRLAGLYFVFAIGITFPLLNPSCGSPRTAPPNLIRV